MKIVFVSVENSISTIGFRKMAAWARNLHSAVDVLYVAPGNIYSPWTLLFKGGLGETQLAEEDVDLIADRLARADLVCFSSMSSMAALTKKIIGRIRQRKPCPPYIIWGGIHPILDPVDAIASADAICVGEGEWAFKTFLDDFKAGRDFTSTPNFWFRQGNQTIKNGFLPLLTPDELDQMPYPLYDDGEEIFESGKGFIPLDMPRYLSFNGLAYNTVWTIGCPFGCIYCGNSKFIENDPAYRKIRHSSVDRLIGEVRAAITKHPHLSVIVLHDDSFLGLPIEILQEFSRKWRAEISLPFAIFGVIPVYVSRDKIQVLVQAGMNRLRMGVQSGSDRILAFYHRPNPPGQLREALSIIGEFSAHMIPPAFDFIFDNPVESAEDVQATLRLIYDLPRPFEINFFALRVIPNTLLAKEFENRGVVLKKIHEGYTQMQPTLGNTIASLLGLFKPGPRAFSRMLRWAKPCTEQQEEYPHLLAILRGLLLIQRGLRHLRNLDFSVIPGRIGWLFWKLGIIQYFRRR